MLAQRKQEWGLPAEEQRPTPARSPKRQPQCDRRLRTRLGSIFLGMTLLAMAGAMASEHIVSLGYDVVKTKAQILSLEKENEQLQLEIAQLRSPQRIQAIATREMGMVTPQNLYCAQPPAAPATAPSQEEPASLWNRMKTNLKGATAQAGTAR